MAAVVWGTGAGVDMQIAGTWTDVSQYIREGTGISIQRGRSGEGGSVSPSSCSFSLNNADGRFSPRNPSGPYYGGIGRNTPVRVWRALSTVAMDTIGAIGDHFQTSPSAVGVASGTDLDIRIDCEPETWYQSQTLAAQGTGAYTAGLTRWVFAIDESGYLHFSAGVSLLNADFKSTLPVQAAIRQSLRVTYDANNGSGGATCTFYTSDSVGGTWTALGSSVAITGTSPVGSTSGYSLTVGDVSQTAAVAAFPAYKPFRGRIYAMRMYSGISGTIIANPDFTAQSSGATSFTDSASVAWTASGNASCSNRRYRFYGEVSSWSPRWDKSGKDVTCDVECGGVLRRLGQGETPLQSAMYRYYTNPNGIYTFGLTGGVEFGPYSPKYYWPLEDGPSATQFASAIGGKPGVITGSPVLGDYDGFQASAPIPHWVTGSSARFQTPGFTSGGFTAEFLMSAPSGMAHGAVIARVDVAGGTRYELSYPDTDTLMLVRTTTTDSASSTTSSGSLVTSIVGKLNQITLTSDGTTVRLLIQAVTDSTNTLLGSVPDVGNAVTSVWVDPGGIMNDVYLGHLAVFDGTTAVYGGYSYMPQQGLYTTSPINAYAGETAPSRARRLIGEQALTEYVIGGGGNAYPYASGYTDTGGSQMGYQTAKKFTDLLQECEESDLGTVYEPRNCLGIGYRTRKSFYNQAAQVTLDYNGSTLSGDFQPDEDDQVTRNDVTVTRTGGSSSRVTDTTTAMGTAAPPAGVGTYDDAVEVSLLTDDQTAQNASWRVHLGTVNELRYPSITTALENSGVASSTSLQVSILNADIGDRVVITNQPAWLPPDQITQSIVGYSEYIDTFSHQITFYTVPESPYHVGVVGTARVDSLGSSTNATMTTTATSMQVYVAPGHALWTTSVGGGFDVLVGGERMTVTAITGSSSPQTFTVTRHVNGVVKSHAVGESVRLFNTPYVALNS